MLLTDRAIEMFAKDLGLSPGDLRTQLEDLDEHFRQSYAKNDWMGCLGAVKKQNRLLGLYAIEVESDDDEEDWVENVG